MDKKKRLKDLNNEPKLEIYTTCISITAINYTKEYIINKLVSGRSGNPVTKFCLSFINSQKVSKLLHRFPVLPDTLSRGVASGGKWCNAPT